MVEPLLATTKYLRQFLTDHFSDEELVILCHDYYPDVKKQFTLGMTLGQMVELLLTYCDNRNRGELPALATLLANKRPEIAKKLTARAELEASCPYRGLRYFEATHAAYFFGRDETIQALLTHIEQTWFVGVIGASGSGKSSLVRAGVLHRLHQRSPQWRTGVITPGIHPLRALAMELICWDKPDASLGIFASETDDLLATWEQATDSTRSLDIILAHLHDQQPDHPMLLVVDQFEELYTQEQITADHRQRFIDLLIYAAASQHMRVVVAIRADFYDYVLRDPQLGKVFSAGEFAVLPLNEQQLRAAIEQPVRVTERYFEPGLVDTIVQDIANEPGNLPLLQFALTQLWEQQTAQGMLTHIAYHEIGRVQGALASYAEKRFTEFALDEQALIRHVFVQLVQPGAGTTDTRRLAQPRDFRADQEVEPLLRRLADTRLIVTGRKEERETVEVAHEALIRGWQRLRGWMDTDREFRMWQERLRHALHQWEQNNNDAGALLRGAPLVEAEDWLQNHQTDLGKDEQAYIQASVALREQEQAEKEAARRRNLKMAWAISAVLLVALALTAWFGWQANVERNRANAQQQTAVAERDRANAQQQTAVAERDRVDQQATIALSRQLAAQAESVREENSDLSLLLSVQADIVTSTVESKNAIFSGVQNSSTFTSFSGVQNSSFSTTLLFHDNREIKGAISPKGDAFVYIAGSDTTVELWDLASYQPTLRVSFSDHTSTVTNVAFSPDGNTLAYTFCGKIGKSRCCEQVTIKLWDITSEPPTLRATLTDHTDFVTALAFSPDGQTLASSSWDDTIMLWDITSTHPVHRTIFDKSPIFVTDLAFSPDGQTLASSDKISFVLWDITSDPPSQKVTFTDPDHAAHPTSMVFSPDGQTFVVSGKDNIVLWNIMHDPPTVRVRLSGSGGNIVFSPDGNTLASWTNDNNTIKLWDITNDPPSCNATLAKYTSRITSVAFNPNGHTLTSITVDGTVKVWEIEIAVWKSHICRTVKNNLSFSEWQQYLGNRISYKKTCPNLPIGKGVLEHGNELARQGNVDEAIAWYEYLNTIDDTLQIDPQRDAASIAVFALVEQGEQLAREGKVREATEVFSQSLTLSPTLTLRFVPDPHQRAVDLAVSELVEQGEQLAREGKVREATEVFSQSFTLSPTLDLDPQARAIELAVEYGDKLARQGDHDEAIAWYEYLLTIDDTLDIDPQARTRWAVCPSCTGDGGGQGVPSTNRKRINE